MKHIYANKDMKQQYLNVISIYYIYNQPNFSLSAV